MVGDPSALGAAGRHGEPLLVSDMKKMAVAATGMAAAKSSAAAAIAATPAVFMSLIPG